jgi:hypothetical protein
MVNPSRASTPIETALNRHRPGPVIHLLPPRTPSRRLSWLSGYVMGLVTAAVAVGLAMVLG